MKLYYTKAELDSAYNRVRELPKEDIDAINIVLLHALRIGRLTNMLYDFGSTISRWDFMQIPEMRGHYHFNLHDPESDFIDAVEKTVIQVDKEDIKDSMHEVPPILQRRSGRYPWGQSVNDEDPNKGV